MFKCEFYDLEREGVLDHLNETDLFCLHYVYLPRLNNNLDFSAHNSHKVWTKSNNTPAQIFWTNLHLTFFGDCRDYNNAWMGVNTDELIHTNLPHVQVPVTLNSLNNTEYAKLQCMIDSLSSTCGKQLLLLPTFGGRSCQVMKPFFFGAGFDWHLIFYSFQNLRISQFIKHLQEKCVVC